MIINIHGAFIEKSYCLAMNDHIQKKKWELEKLIEVSDSPDEYKYNLEMLDKLQERLDKEIKEHSREMADYMNRHIERLFKHIEDEEDDD